LNELIVGTIPFVVLFTGTLNVGAVYPLVTFVTDNVEVVVFSAIILVPLPIPVVVRGFVAEQAPSNELVSVTVTVDVRVLVIVVVRLVEGGLPDTGREDSGDEGALAGVDVGGDEGGGTTLLEEEQVAQELLLLDIELELEVAGVVAGVVAGLVLELGVAGVVAGVELDRGMVPLVETVVGLELVMPVELVVGTELVVVELDVVT
jgi:hypothetical protein